jgi:hypothetical protein
LGSVRIAGLVPRKGGQVLHHRRLSSSTRKGRVKRSSQASSVRDEAHLVVPHIPLRRGMEVACNPNGKYRFQLRAFAERRR